MNRMNNVDNNALSTEFKFKYDKYSLYLTQISMMIIQDHKSLP